MECRLPSFVCGLACSSGGGKASKIGSRVGAHGGAAISWGARGRAAPEMGALAGRAHLHPSARHRERSRPLEAARPPTISAMRLISCF